MSSPYDEGRDALYHGLARSSNPYPAKSDQHTSWQNGWDDECRDFIKAREYRINEASAATKIGGFRK